ncbi:hypothetical protein ACEOQV_31795 [Pseudomonas aeruginosa]
MAAFIAEESKGRPAGAPEFLAYSPKTACPVRLYCRPSFWRWATIEFDPYATGVSVNQLVLNVQARKSSVALRYETADSTYLIFSKREVNTDVETEILEYAEKNGFQCQFLDFRCKQEEVVHAENLLCMLSYINKFRDSLSNKNLDCALRLVDRSQNTIQGAIAGLNERFTENSGALLFELVRRGKLVIPDIKGKRLSGTTHIKPGGVGYE